MISYHPLCTFSCATSEKKKKIYFVSTWFERFRSVWELWMTLCNKYQSKSDILWWHVLVIQRCPMKYWKQRYVGVDFDHCRPCLSSAALRLCQTRSKHTATCVAGQSFPQNSHSPCPAYLQQRWVPKIQPTACTALIYLLVCHMLCVTLRRNRGVLMLTLGHKLWFVTLVDGPTETRDSHTGKLSHALWDKLFSQSWFVRARFIKADLKDTAMQK